jgi:hypothetical protein
MRRRILGAMRRRILGADRAKILRQLLGGEADQFGGQHRGMFQCRSQQHPRAEAVDPAWNATGMLMHQVKGRLLPGGIAGPAYRGHAVPDVQMRLLPSQRGEVIGGEDALAELVEIRPGQGLAQLRLTQQQHLQQRVRALGHVGKHAQFLERGDRQGLRLVYDEDLPPAPFNNAAAQRLDDALQQLRLAALGRGAEGDGDEAQQLRGLDLCRHHSSHGMALGGEFGTEPFDQGGLAGAHLAGDNNEALALRQAVDQMRIGATVRRAWKEQPHIRCHAERLLVEAVHVEIHGVASEGSSQADADDTLRIALVRYLRGVVCPGDLYIAGEVALQLVHQRCRQSIGIRVTLVELLAKAGLSEAK